MPDTTFVFKQTVITSTWCNDVNDAVYHAIGTGVGGVAPTSPADVRTNLGLTAIGGAALIGNNTAGGSLGANVQAALDLKLNASAFADVIHQHNNWDAANTPGNAQQLLEYTVPTTSSSVDHGGWVAYVHNQGTNADNLVPVVGHGYHDALFDNLTGAVWGVVTEAWSNTTNYTTLVGGEFATIARDPDTAAPSVGSNVVFKNRLDGVTSVTAGAGLFNRYSSGLLITSQNRPTTGPDTQAGSGWNAAITVGDIGFGAGLDWEGGSHYPASSTYKAYSMVLNLTNALTDLAGGYPWHTLYKNSLTYWGMRFNGVLSGALDTYNVKVTAGGAGYAIGDQGTILTGSATAKYQVTDVAAGVVTKLAILGANRGASYGAGAGVATAATTGVGAGLTVDISPASGYVFGGDLGIAAGGAGYAVNDVATVNGSAAGYIPLAVRVTTVAAGVVTGFILITTEESPGGIRISQGRGYATGAHATTNVIGTGAGFQVSINKVYTDISIGGEKWEYWRMSNPSNPTATGSRDSFIDAGFPPMTRTVGIQLNDSYSGAVIQAITPSPVPTIAAVGSQAVAHLAMASTDPAWNAAAVGAYAGKIAVIIDGVTKYIPVYA